VTDVVFEPGVVGQGGIIVRLERGAEFVGLLAGAAIDNTSLVRVSPQETNDLRQLVFARFDGKKQVLAIKARDKLALRRDPELLTDILTNTRSGGCGEKETSGARETFADAAELAIFRAEVVPPFRDTVGLVDSEEASWLCSSNRRVSGRSNVSGAR
jgi:hypothetical protein